MFSSKRKKASDGANALSVGIATIILGVPIAYVASSGMAIGITESLWFALIPLIFVPIGIFYGVRGLKKDENKKLAKAGLIVSILALALAVIAFILGFVLSMLHGL